MLLKISVAQIGLLSTFSENVLTSIPKNEFPGKHFGDTALPSSHFTDEKAERLRHPGCIRMSQWPRTKPGAAFPVYNTPLSPLRDS